MLNIKSCFNILCFIKIIVIKSDLSLFSNFDAVLPTSPFDPCSSIMVTE